MVFSLSAETPSPCRNSLAALARRSPSPRLYSAEPRSSQWPSTTMDALGKSLRMLFSAAASLRSELFGGAGAAVAQPEIVLGGAAFVAMALDDDGRIGEIAQDALQRGGILGENVAGVTADIGLIVVEVSVQDFRRDALRKGNRRRGSRRRRGRRRRRHVDRGGSRVGSARTGGGHCIGRGIARVDATAASALYGTNALVDGYAGDGAGDFPTQGACLATLNRGGLRRELRHGGSGRLCRGWLDHWRRRRRRGRGRHLLLTS